MKNSTLLIILLAFHSVYPKDFSVFIDNKINCDDIVFTQPGDTVTFRLNVSEKGLSWAEFCAAATSYDNTTLKQRYSCTPVKYNIKLFTKADTVINFTILSDTLLPGTYYFGIHQNNTDTCLISSYPIYSFPGIVQIVNRKSDTYYGYLEELNNTPFILVPKVIPSYGHQTDCRIGSDCAEFLIYGKRRQGFNIPYCGPKKMIKYLTPVNKDNITEGCIIHFGEQTALLYKDNGIKNCLDDEDILFQCYKRGPEKIKFKDSEFRRYTFKVYLWKPGYN